MTELAKRALEFALADLGVHESPPGSNRGPEIDGYIKDVGLDPVNHHYPWCASFVSSKIKHAGESLPTPVAFRGSASCKRLVDLNMSRELSAPEPGCVFVMLHPDGTGHAGFVVELNADGSFLDISGNSDASGSRTGGMVCQNVRKAGFAQHFIKVV